MIELVTVLNSARTVEATFRDEKSAGLAAAEIVFGPRNDYDEIRLDDTVARTSKLVAVAPAPWTPTPAAGGGFVLVRGVVYPTRAAADAAAAARNRR